MFAVEMTDKFTFQTDNEIFRWPTRIFEAIVISAKFLRTCLIFEILNDKEKDKDSRHLKALSDGAIFLAMQFHSWEM